jgi:hypothetical protein
MMMMAMYPSSKSKGMKGMEGMKSMKGTKSMKGKSGSDFGWNDPLDVRHAI